jgi:hypothetical protein
VETFENVGHLILDATERFHVVLLRLVSESPHTELRSAMREQG